MNRAPAFNADYVPLPTVRIEGATPPPFLPDPVRPSPSAPQPPLAAGFVGILPALAMLTPEDSPTGPLRLSATQQLPRPPVLPSLENPRGSLTGAGISVFGIFPSTFEHVNPGVPSRTITPPPPTRPYRPTPGAGPYCGRGPSPSSAPSSPSPSAASSSSAPAPFYHPQA